MYPSHEYRLIETSYYYILKQPDSRACILSKGSKKLYNDLVPFNCLFVLSFVHCRLTIQPLRKTSTLNMKKYQSSQPMTFKT